MRPAPEADYSSWAEFNPPIGLDQKNSTHELTELHLNQALSWCFGDYAVLDKDDKPLFQCKGKFNMRMEKNLYDADGNLLYNMNTSPWSLARKTVIRDNQGRPVFEIKKSSVWKNNLEATFIDDATEKETTLQFDGSWCRDRGKISLDDKPVAQIWRESVWKGKRGIIIAPGVDAALAVAIAIVFDMVQMESYAGLAAAAGT